MATGAWALETLKLAPLALAYWWKVAAVAPVVHGVVGVVAQPPVGPQGWEAQDLLETLVQVWAVSHTRFRKGEGGEKQILKHCQHKIPSPMDNTLLN